MGVACQWRQFWTIISFVDILGKWRSRSPPSYMAFRTGIATKKVYIRLAIKSKCAASCTVDIDRRR